MTDELNYGPLTALTGTWKGDMGTDISPEPEGIENNPYCETIIFTAKTNDVVMHSLTIPRGVCLLAGGKAEETKRFEHTDENVLTRQ